jgi:hypothetical protein
MPVSARSATASRRRSPSTAQCGPVGGLGVGPSLRLDLALERPDPLGRDVPLRSLCQVSPSPSRVTRLVIRHASCHAWQRRRPPVPGVPAPPIPGQAPFGRPGQAGAGNGAVDGHARARRACGCREPCHGPLIRAFTVGRSRVMVGSPPSMIGSCGVTTRLSDARAGAELAGTARSIRYSQGRGDPGAPARGRRAPPRQSTPDGELLDLKKAGGGAEGSRTRVRGRA